ncbi:two-component system, response regulator YesN [Evansella caseinilytica]|uniref:Two-component system, response regulator YesN n=1 Tax=Evansella caseinilytica TaxID=1503961 RepID=A0A1H3USP9_9BACI|nr:response regulator [Evansella caseinilytica]SDZ65358.1 two-component system, response regulator YesN [Evansella caseinilytica]
MNVLIVDDEIQIRKGLKVKVNWEKEGFRLVGEASNGIEAMDILEKQPVDLIITDVRMPKADGLELARLCHKRYKHIKVIVLSGYADFEYVKTSMKEGVRDYLLKPVSPEELRAALRVMYRELEEEKKKRRELDHISRLANSHLQEAQEQYLLFLVMDEWEDAYLVKERLKQLQLEPLTQDEIKAQIITIEMRAEPKRVKELWHPFQLLSRETTQNQSSIYFFINPNYRYMIHFLVLINKETNIHHFISYFQQQAKKLMNIDTVIAVGQQANGLEKLTDSYISSLLSWSQSPIGILSQVVDSTSLYDDIYDLSADHQKRLINVIESLQLCKFKQHLEDIFEEIEHPSVWSFSFLANRTLFLLGSMAKKYDMESGKLKKWIWECQQDIWKYHSQDQVKESLNQLAASIIEQIRLARFSNGKLIVESIKHYLDEHYAAEITLTSLSMMYHMNSAYLSELFKSHIGENFSDYLTKVRMEKAKFFLKDPELKIIDIASLVGFSNSGYFSTVFKKYFGSTPVEYRKSLEVV